MKQKWGRPEDAGDFPSDKAVWTIGAFCVALLSVFAIVGYRYMRVWTPLQRHYLTTYVGTPVAGAFRTDGGYTLLMVVTRKGPRMALDAEVEPFVTEKGESTFTLTEAAMKTGDLKLECSDSEGRGASENTQTWASPERTGACDGACV